MKRSFSPTPTGLHPQISSHAEKRMSSRRLPPAAVEAVLTWGRLHHVRGADIFVLGRRDLLRLTRMGLDLSHWEGIHVVCSNDGLVLTTYRNHNLSKLRPRGRSRRPPTRQVFPRLK